MTGPDPSYVFGRFRLNAGTRTLLANDAPLPLSSRAFEILLMLIEHRDRVVTKDEMMERVWTGAFVEENNLAVQVSILRRVLSAGEGAPPLIITVPGRGYRFVGQIEQPPHIDDSIATDEAVFQVQATKPVRPWRKRGLAAGGALALAVAAIVLAEILVGRSSPATQRARPPPISAFEAPPRLSIVVLPFRDLGDDQQESYLADAVSDDLTTDLSHLPGSFVIARASADVYKTRRASANQIGRELGVRYLLEGSLRRSGDSLTINAQLIDTETGSHLWAKRFETPRRQLSEAQEDIVRQIASALNFTLVEVESRRSLRDRPTDPDALDLLLRARSILNRNDTLKGLVDAQGLLERATTLQPDFPEAIGELAWVLLRKVSDFDDPEDAVDIRNVRKLVARGIELAPQSSRILAARGFLLKVDGKLPEAIASFQSALSLDPNDVEALSGLALSDSNIGLADKAADLLRHALLLDPQDSKNRIRYNQLGLIYLMLGRSDDAVATLRKAAVGDPDPVAADGLSRREWNEIGTIAALSLQGRTEEARARYRSYTQLWPNRTVWRIRCYFSRAESSLPGLQAALSALKVAGMPEFADETQDQHVGATATPRSAGDFDPTPVTVPRGQTVVTAVAANLLAQAPPPLVVDVGCGAGIPPSALWINRTFPSTDGEESLKRAIAERIGDAPTRRIMIVGSNIYDWNGYNAALAALEFGYPNISWYRGGEEAWVSAQLRHDDRRDP